MLFSRIYIIRSTIHKNPKTGKTTYEQQQGPEYQHKVRISTDLDAETWLRNVFEENRGRFRVGVLVSRKDLKSNTQMIGTIQNTNL